MLEGAKGSTLYFEGFNNTAADAVRSNIEAALQRGYEPLREVRQYQGPVSIVGAGSSLISTYQDIVGDVIACNSAHDFLIDKGIIPKYAMVWDAHAVMGGIIKRPHKDVRYLIASRCTPAVFDSLKGFDVTVWHALGDACLEELLIKYQRMEPMLAGGSAAVTRATHLAGAMGYTKEMHLFGVSGGEDGRTPSHCMPRIGTPQQTIRMRICGRWWEIEPWMAMQLGDFKLLIPHLKACGQERIVVHGDGLIPYAATYMEGVETPDVRVSAYERHLKRPLHALILKYLAIQQEFATNPQLLGGT